MKSDNTNKLHYNSMFSVIFLVLGYLDFRAQPILKFKSQMYKCKSINVFFLFTPLNNSIFWYLYFNTSEITEFKNQNNVSFMSNPQKLRSTNSSSVTKCFCFFYGFFKELNTILLTHTKTSSRYCLSFIQSSSLSGKGISCICANNLWRSSELKLEK
jgi:hypothetical protein